MQLTIGGQTVTVEHGSLDIVNAIGQRSTIQRMRANDYSGSLQFFQGQPIYVYDDSGNLIFAGALTQDQRSRPSQYGTQWHDIQASDWHYLADKRVAAYAAQNKVMQGIIYDLITNYLAYEGVYAIKNLLSANQSDVETDTTGFSALQGSGTTLSRDTSNFWHGAASLKVVCDGSVAAQGFRATIPLTNFQPGETITLSCYLKGAGTLNVLAVRTDTFSRIGSAATAALPAGSWQRLSTTITLPNPLPTSGQIGIQIDTTSAQAVTFWSDGLQIEPGAGTSPIRNLYSSNQADVETDTTGFLSAVGSGGAMTRDTAQHWHGASSLKVVTDGSGTFQFVNAELAASAFTPGQQYTASFWVLGQSAGGTLRYFVDSDSGAVSSVQTLTLSTGWTRYAVTFTAAAGKAWMGLRLDTGNPAQALTFWWDGLQMEMGSAANAWVAGGSVQQQPATAWELGGTTTVQTGPTIVNFVSAYATCSDCLDALIQSAGSGWYWQIDAYKRLWVQQQSSAPLAPFTVDDTSGDTIERGTDVLTHGNTQYRNSQYMLGGVAQTSTQTETRKGDGATQTFTMSYDLNSAPTITLNGASQTVGLKGGSGSQWYWAPGDPVIAQDTSGTKLVSTDTLQVVYIGQFQNVALSQDNNAISTQQMREGAGTGLVEAAALDTTISGTNQAFQSAAGFLSKYAQDLNCLQFTTKYHGLQQGQLVTVNIPAYNLVNQQMLIQSVEITDIGPVGAEIGDLWYLVTAVSGPINQTWQQFFKALATQGQQLVNSITVGQAQSLVLLVSAAVAYSWAVSGTAKVNTLLTPSATLFPQTTLYPGTAGAPVAITWTKTQAGLNALRDSGLGLATAYFAWGTGTQGTPATATQLAAEAGRKPITSFIPGSAAGEELITAYLSPQDAVGVNITEVGIFVGPSAGSSANSGTLLLYGAYTQAKTNQQSIQFSLDSTLS